MKEFLADKLQSGEPEADSKASCKPKALAEHSQSFYYQLCPCLAHISTFLRPLSVIHAFSGKVLTKMCPEL